MAPRLSIGRMLCGAVLLTMVTASLVGCRHPAPDSRSGFSFSTHETAFIDTLQERTFRYFWDLCNPETGLAPDRWPTRSFASIAATGFALTAYPIGCEHGWIPREQGARRTLRTLDFLWRAPQNASPDGAAGYHGFFYHFQDPATGIRFDKVELSTMDTALLLAGVLFCGGYFDGATSCEDSLRALADSLYLRVDWTWAQIRPPLIGHGWNPETGHLPYDWGGYNEAMLLYILALGSPTHPVDAAAWTAWTSTYRFERWQGQQQIGFAPLFGHQYTQVWLDLRGIQDAYTRARGLDYFENSRRAVLSQYAYAQANPGGWSGYGQRLWGLTACDGPADGWFVLAGRKRELHTYWARGASFTHVNDDGTICPSAAAGSLPFAPEVVAPTLLAMREDHSDRLFGPYGFRDALNPSFDLVGRATQPGAVSEYGWYDADYLGIDQGPIVAMIENARTGLVWRVMRRNRHVVAGLRRAGFTGGWLDTALDTP